MIQIRRINESIKNDINLPNEPFSLWGRLIPSYDGGNWSYSVEKYSQDMIKDMVFPDENYNFDERKLDTFFVGAYEEGVCIGLAVYKTDWFKYLYLEDLKVTKTSRGSGIGKLLIEEGLNIATENNYIGIYTIAQDNNLSACLFYLKSGFSIGGLNTRCYQGTNQEGKHNIYFYMDHYTTTNL